MKINWWRLVAQSRLTTGILLIGIYFLSVALYGWSWNPVPIFLGMFLALLVNLGIRRPLTPVELEDRQVLGLDLVLTDEGPQARFSYDRKQGVPFEAAMDMCLKTLASAQAEEWKHRNQQAQQN